MKNKQIVTMTKRDSSIDILKFIAVFLITWSHFEEPLGKYAFFATGGNLGNTVFFFISGYTLLLSNRNITFFNWYKRRINRIYPSVFAWALVGSLLLNKHNDILYILLYGGGFFVTSIMVCYLMFYPIKKYIPANYWIWIMFFFLIMHACMWLYVDRTNYYIHKSWLNSSYFLAMMAGALIGKYRKDGALTIFSSYNKYVLILTNLICVIIYYILMYLESKWNESLEILNIIPLVGFAITLFAICCRTLPSKMIQNNNVYWLIRFVGGLCLEVYIVQPYVISDNINFLFPLNLLLFFVAIIIAAYCLRTIGRLWAQTFKDEDYNIKQIVAPF